jgi:hypothetical protein
MLVHPYKESDIYPFFSQNEASLFKTSKDASEVDQLARICLIINCMGQFFHLNERRFEGIYALSGGFTKNAFCRTGFIAICHQGIPKNTERQNGHCDCFWIGGKFYTCLSFLHCRNKD